MITAKDYLKQYIARSTPIIRSTFRQEIKIAQKISPINTGMMKRLKRFMGGGKRLRGAQIVLGYEIFGGKLGPEILKASAVIEIVHSFFLIHDDIMDEDSLRRGEPTIHKQYEDYHRTKFKKRNSSHYGSSMAINLGDIDIILAQKVLTGLKFPADRILKVSNFLSNLLIQVAHGQALDITYESYSGLKEEDVLRVHRHKTADYTVSGPLTIGGILAGRDLEELGSIYRYGTPVGIAFQLRDDELGMFSSSEILGKPAESDLRESKNTILILKALEKANAGDRAFLLWAHGNTQAHLLTPKGFPAN